MSEEATEAPAAEAAPPAKGPTYKLTYFNIMSLAEPIRMILSYMGEEFEDERIDPMDWGHFKPEMKFGKVPKLEEEGKVMCQSGSICRYLATKCGLNGVDAWENFLIDEIVDIFTDFRLELSKVIQEHNDEEKTKKKETLLHDIYPYYFSRFEDIIEKNNGFFVNGKMTWADIFVTGVSGTFEKYMGVKIGETYPNFGKMMESVLSEPMIKIYVENRPETTY